MIGDICKELVGCTEPLTTDGTCLEASQRLEMHMKSALAILRFLHRPFVVVIEHNDAEQFKSLMITRLKVAEALPRDIDRAKSKGPLTNERAFSMMLLKRELTSSSSEPPSGRGRAGSRALRGEPFLRAQCGFPG